MNENKYWSALFFSFAVYKEKAVKLCTNRGENMRIFVKCRMLVP